MIQPTNGSASVIMAASSSRPGPRRRRTGGCRDLLGRAEALEHVADRDFVDGARLAETVVDVLANLGHELRPAPTPEAGRGRLEPVQVLGHELVGVLLPHCSSSSLSSPSTPSRNRAHSTGKPASASRPQSVSW